MKLIKRVVTIIMVLTLMAMPMTSLAEGQLQSFSIGNFSADVLGTPMNLGLNLSFEAGELNGRKIVTITASGAEQIGNITAVVDDEGIKAMLDGMSAAYAITSEEIARLGESLSQQAQVQVEVPEGFDTQAITDMVTGYAKLLETASDPKAAMEMQEKIYAEFLDYLGEGMETGVEESFTVFEKQFEGKRLKMNLTMEDMDKYFEIFTNYNENAKKFFNGYFKFLSSVLASEGIKVESESMSGLFKAIGADFSAVVDLVKEDNGQAAMADMTMTIKDETSEFSLPMHMDMLDDEHGQRVAVTLDSVIDDIPMYVRAETHIDDASGDYIFDMKAGPEGEEISISMDMSMAKHDPEETLTLIADFVVADQQLMEVRIVYDGAVAQNGTDVEHDGKLTIYCDLAGTGNLSLSTDIKWAKVNMTGDEFAKIDSMPVVNFSDLDAAGQEKLKEEAATVGINALGALMQTPGVADIISVILAAAQTSTTNTSGNNEDFEDFDDFEDFGDWDDFEEFGDWDDEVAA